MKRLFMLFTIFTLLVVPQFALGSDEDDLKAVSDKMWKAYNTLDAETIAAMIYPGGVLYDGAAAFPDVAPMENTKADRSQVLKMSFGSLEYLSIVPYNLQYRVVGNTGIIWGHYTTYYKVKGETGHTVHARFTSTWVKEGGKWHIIMGHISAIPPSN